MSFLDLTGNRFTRRIPKFTSTASIKNEGAAAGIGVVDDQLYVNVTGSPVLLQDFLAGTATPANLGTKNGSTVTVAETVSGPIHTSVFTLTATPMTIADATAGGGVKIYTFPEGALTILGGKFSLTPTTTSVLASTLKASKTLDIGVGTASAGAGALTTTEDDIIDSVAGTSSATINVAGATSNAVRTTAPVIFDGSAAAKTVNVNIGVPTGTDIDADATVTVTGTVTIQWLFNGDI